MSVFEDNFRRLLDDVTDRGSVKQIYTAVSEAAMRHLRPAWHAGDGRRACYFSAEFLIGRVVYSNLYNLGLLGEMRALFEQNGLDFGMFECVDDDALGNGGLGRLAACFLDSAATCRLPLDGYGIRYRYGLFKQYFDKGFQNEIPDEWLRFGDPWSLRREDERELVCFKDQKVWAVPYDMPVVGYGQGAPVNTLRLWQAEPFSELDFAAFNEQDYAAAYKARNEAEAISAVLYPNDDTPAGKRLRLKQQYFFSAASLASMLRRYKAKYSGDMTHFAEAWAVQLNDTHPTVAIPELLRLLCAEEQMEFSDAFAIAQSVFAYTNHTIMAEALEKWDADLFCSVIPEVYPYVVMVQNHLRRQLTARGVAQKEQPGYDIIDNGRIHMARLAVFGTHSTNGVAALHTEILKHDALKEWYALWPERFSNKTNGITQRRWLGLCNPQLAGFITERIGDGWLTNLAELERLVPYADDAGALDRFAAIKRENKERLAGHVRIHEYEYKLNCDSVFDVQVKRLHEYKRQLLNAFSILDIYFALKDGHLPDFAPMTCLFGAKAAPGYRRAKGIIKFIGEIARKVNADPDTRDRLQVLFVQNYNVSYAEKLIPAADLSEQISTAGTEASGTGNMKLMLNGAVTLGTYDGANIEIVAESGEENNFIFGARVEDLAKIAESYDPKKLYESQPRLRRVVDTLVDGTFSDEKTGWFRELYDSLLEGASWHKPDQYYLFCDFEPYVEAKLRANRATRNQRAFARMCLLNTAHAGKFSSDRTIREYASEIWGL